MNPSTLRLAPHSDAISSDRIRRPRVNKARTGIVSSLLWLLLSTAGMLAPAIGTAAEVDAQVADRAAELINKIRHKLDACGDEGMMAMNPKAQPVKTKAEIEARPSLRWNPTLAQTAQVHSESMARERFFDHIDMHGKTVGARARAAGYRYRVVGENLAAGHETIDEAVRGWLLSTGHCKNLIDGRFTEFGLARVRSPHADDPYGNYWTLVLGVPQGSRVASR